MSSSASNISSKVKFVTVAHFCRIGESAASIDSAVPFVVVLWKRIALKGQLQAQGAGTGEADVPYLWCSSFCSAVDEEATVGSTQHARAFFRKSVQVPVPKEAGQGEATRGMLPISCKGI